MASPIRLANIFGLSTPKYFLVIHTARGERSHDYNQPTTQPKAYLGTCYSLARSLEMLSLLLVRDPGRLHYDAESLGYNTVPAHVLNHRH